MNNLIDKIRESNNSIYVTDAVTRLAHVAKNKRYNEIRDLFLQNDPMFDFEGYLNIIESIRPELDAGEVRPHFVGCENEAYGHYAAIQDYGGYTSKSSGMIMEHGVNFSVSLPSSVNLNETFALFFQSKYKNTIVHARCPHKLTFCVGPYIHYAASFYDAEQIHKWKEIYGKIALIYLSHDTHESKVLRNYTAYREFAERYTGKYDTVMFCVYWRDVNREVYDTIQKIPNAKIVSAGFLYDPSFIRRTKSFMQMADVVVTDEIGTSVGYALYMNKKVEVISSKDVRIMDQKTMANVENQRRVENALQSNDREKINEVYEEFWGGSCIKSRDEMREILGGLDEIRVRSKGRKDRFAETVEEKIDEWRGKDSLKYQLFKSALE